MTQYPPQLTKDLLNLARLFIMGVKDGEYVAKDAHFLSDIVLTALEQADEVEMKQRLELKLVRAE